ncbi:MAG TPA: hypothetical protein QF564_30270 [Pirellulaceae bacterium]|jgi:hypothetical protein|nr:hypothetical protein [Pirellulaceae bacterium]
MASKRKNPKQWRLQLRLSTAFLLVALSAVVCAWVTDHRQLRQVINEDADRLQYLEYELRFHDNDARSARSILERWKRVYDRDAIDRAVQKAIRPPIAPANPAP